MTENVKRRLIFLLFLVPLAISVIYFARTVLNLFVIAFFLAYALNPLVEFFQKKGARRDWAILTVYLILFLSGALVMQLLVPRVIRDLLRAIQRLPVLIQELQLIESQMIRVLKDWQIPVDWSTFNDTLAQRSESLLKGAILQIGHWIVNLFSRSLAYLLLPLLAYYISRDYLKMKEKALQWIQGHGGPLWSETFLKIDGVCRSYIRCQILDIAVVGLLIGCGLSILGFEAAFFLGVMAGLLNLIPYFGPVLGAIPPFLFGLWQSPWKALYVVILFLLVNQIEVMFLAPRIMGATLGLHPLTVIFLILVGGSLFGVLGMVLAVPLGTIILIFLHSLYQACYQRAERTGPKD